MSTIITFCETEQPDEAFFRAELAGHDVRAVETLGDVRPDTEVLSVFIYSPIDAKFLAEHPRLKLIVTRSSSLDHLDLPACRERGVAVSSVPESGESTVAEHTFALILALSRRLREVMALSQDVHKKPFSYEAVRGFELEGKTLGIIGMGRIGRRVAELALAFRMRVLAYDPAEMPPALAAERGFAWRERDALLAETDILTLHVRLSASTYHLLDRAALARCRPGALVINTARGRLIDTDALREALESGQIGGAGLDVLEDERVMRATASQIISAQIVERLHADAVPDAAGRPSRVQSLRDLVRSDAILARPNVVFTPHVAFNSLEAVERLNAATVENIRAFLAGKPVNLVE